MKTLRVAVTAGVLGLALPAGMILAAGSTTSPSSPAVGPGTPSDTRPDFSAGPALAERLKAALADLDLSADQKEKIKAIVGPFRQEMQSWRKEHEGEIQKLRTDLQAARADKDRQKVRAAAQEARQIMQSLPKPKEVLEQIKEVLTPAQREKLKAKLEGLRENVKDELKEKLQKKAGETA